jgi:hypothetical protein
VRTVRLAHTAVCAERLRLHRAARRMVVRAVLLVVALSFLLLSVGFAHLAAWFTFEPRYGAAPAALGLALADLAIACVVVLLAGSLRPGRIEIEAHAVSARAWRGVRQSLDLWALSVAVARVFTARRTTDRG